MKLQSRNRGKCVKCGVRRKVNENFECFTCNPLVPNGIKRCNGCKRDLEHSLFHFNSRSKLGISSQCKACRRNQVNIRNRALRVKVLSRYSGGVPECACCKERNLEFLGIDHIHGGGRQHRKTIKIRWWEWLRKNGYPGGFRVLCHNCNQSIGLYGYCPHQKSDSRLRSAFEAYDENAPNKSHKLTPEIAEEIRKEIRSGVAQNVLAVKYRVSRATICLINSGKHWGDYATV